MPSSVCPTCKGTGKVHSYPRYFRCLAGKLFQDVWYYAVFASNGAMYRVYRTGLVLHHCDYTTEQLERTCGGNTYVELDSPPA